jgi:galactose mutarotase-like enzyme
MFTIENEHIIIAMNAKGAELQRIYHKTLGIEYLWDGDPAFWPKHSPVLFPIVGTLKNNSYFYKGKPYSLGRHGFAREMDFEADYGAPDKISFVLGSNEATLLNYPFSFVFTVTYTLIGTRLDTAYTIENTNSEEMYFSVGGHPAFRLPLVEGSAYSDYFLEFDRDKQLPRWPISKDGLIEKTPLEVPDEVGKLWLSKELFFKDALVYKHPASGRVSLRSDKTPHGLDFTMARFPFIGIWAAKNADFVCIEPWCGIADSVDSDQRLEHKEGINKLLAGDKFEQSWSASFF